MQIFWKATVTLAAMLGVASCADVKGNWVTHISPDKSYMVLMPEEWSADDIIGNDHNGMSYSRTSGDLYTSGCFSLATSISAFASLDSIGLLKISVELLKLPDAKFLEYFKRTSEYKSSKLISCRLTSVDEISGVLAEFSTEGTNGDAEPSYVKSVDERLLTSKGMYDVSCYIHASNYADAEHFYTLYRPVFSTIMTSFRLLH